MDLAVRSIAMHAARVLPQSREIIFIRRRYRDPTEDQEDYIVLYYVDSIHPSPQCSPTSQALATGRRSRVAPTRQSPEPANIEPSGG